MTPATIMSTSPMPPEMPCPGTSSQTSMAPSRAPDRELAFGADVPDAGAEAHRQAQRAQDQRHALSSSSLMARLP
jgi:hypothetical protein